MMDEHDQESQPVHEENTAGEQAADAADGGVWSDDHPPVDDFSDPGSANDEVATASQEVAVEGDDASSATGTGAARSMMPLFAGIGGVLLIGAVIYWQFGGHSSPPPPVMPPAAALSTPKSASMASMPSESKPSATPTSASTAGQEDIASLYKPATETPSPKDTSPATTPTTSMATMPETAPPPPPPPAALPPNPATSMPAATPPAAPSALPQQPASSTAGADARIDTISARIDGLQKSIGDATRQLNQLSNMVAANQAMPPVSSQTNPALEDRLNKIEQNLMQVEHNSTRAPPASASSERIEAPVTTTVRTTSHHARPPAKHKHTHKKEKMHKSSAVPMVAKTESIAPSSSWVLRAATPSEAWVASDARSAELHHVQVGDSLTGVGQIRAIRQTAGGWEIEGTSGSIR